MGFLSLTSALIAAGITMPLLVSLYFLKLRRRELAVPTTLLWKKSIHDLQVNAPFQRLRKNLLLLLQLLILAALLIAMARPTRNALAKPGRRVVIILDHSASMNAADVSPNRLAQAKQAALDLIDALPGAPGSAPGSAGSSNANGAGSGASGGASGAGGAMVVSFAQRASVVQPFTSDLAALRRAVRSIEPTDELSNLAAALRLVQFAAPPGSSGSGGASSGGGLSVYVISDGRATDELGQSLALKGATLRYIRIGTPPGSSPGSPGSGGVSGASGASGGNVAITAFSARRDLDKPRIVQVFARLANYGSAPVHTNVTLKLNGQVAQVQSLTIPGSSKFKVQSSNSNMPPSATAPAAIPPPPSAIRHPFPPPGQQSVQFQFVLVGSAMIELSQDHADQLAADDTARLMLAPSRRLRALLVTKGNPFLQRVIESTHIKQLVVMTPAKYENQPPDALRRTPPGTPGTPGSNAGSTGATSGVSGGGGSGGGFDVIVFDRYSPRQVPPVSSLYFEGAPPIEGLSLKQPPAAATQPRAAQHILDWVRDAPLLRYVSLDDVVLAQPPRLAVPRDARILATGIAGPLMAEVDREGVRHVVVSFDLLQSNWPLYVSFPVFIANAMQQLGLGNLADEAGLAYRTGEVAVVPVAQGVTSLTYRGPVTLHAAVRDRRAILPMLSRAGEYVASGSVAPPYDRLPVNLLDAAESDLRPAATLQVGTTAVTGKSRALAVRREIWPWFVWAALAVLALEWFIYNRRMHL